MTDSCVVCGAPATERMELVSGARLAPSCGTKCSAAIWEAHFDAFIQAPASERAVTAWRWRRRRAEARGEEFTEPSPAERAK